MKSLIRVFFFLSAFTLFSGVATAQNVNVTPNLATYPTLAAAFNAINNGAHTGTLTVTILGNTTEPVSGAVLNASGTGIASYQSILIRPSGARVVSGAITAGTPMIDLNGADNVTIDGLNTGGNSLTISNTTVARTLNTSTIRFIGGASNNTIRNTTIQGSSTASASINGGTIFFSTDSVTGLGNDNNTITNNNIGPAGSNLPSKAIMANGSGQSVQNGNSGIVISNNNIFDYFTTESESAGIVTTFRCSEWTIQGNRFYQTAPRSSSTLHFNYAMLLEGVNAVTGAQNFIVTGNTIGYASSLQTGRYSLGGGSIIFRGVVFEAQAGGAPSVISDNTVANISLTDMTAGGTIFGGIVVNSGAVISNNNTIGSLTDPNSLSITTNTSVNSTVFGIYSLASDEWTSNDNRVGGLQVTNSGAGNITVSAMRMASASGAPWNAADNIIGGQSAGSIRLSSSGLRSQVVAMQSAQSPGRLLRNTIRNLSTNAGSGVNFETSLAGIMFTNSSPNHIVIGNQITGLVNSNTIDASQVVGLFYTAGSGTNVIERNLISGLSSLSGNAGAEVTGIRAFDGTNTFRNNIVILGEEIPNGIRVNGFTERVGNNRLWHNSFLITGAALSGTGTTIAFNTEATFRNRDFRNNIFANTRTNVAATGSNYVVRISGTSTLMNGLTINRNLYYSAGTGAVFGRYFNSDVADLTVWRGLVGQDAESLEANPLFVSASDLHLQAGSPAISQAVDLGVIRDFDQQSRPGSNSLIDIGADETDGATVPAADIAGSAISAPAAGSRVAIGESFTPSALFFNAGLASQTNVPVRYLICTDQLCTSPVYNNVGVIPAFDALGNATVSFPATSLSIEGTYFLQARSELPGDAIPANDAVTSSFIVSGPLDGVATVGVGGDYTSLTNTGGVFDSINRFGMDGALTIQITSDLIDETGAFALNETTGGHSLLIKPSGGMRRISGNHPTALIRLNGADRVTIDGWTGASLVGDQTYDGFVGGNPTRRELTIQNTGPLGNSWVIAIQSGPNGANNNILRNIVVTGNDPDVTAGLISIGGDQPGTEAAFVNNGNQVVNCAGRRAVRGIYNGGPAARNSGNVIAENDLSATGAERITSVGIAVINQDGIQIVENRVGGLEALSADDTIGIAVGLFDVSTETFGGGGISNALVTRNRITSVIQYSNTSAAGIACATGDRGPNVVSNNFVTGVNSGAFGVNITAGIFAAGGSGTTVRILHNSVSLTGTRFGELLQTGSYGIALAGRSATIELKNNVISNTQLPGTAGNGARSYAIGTDASEFTALDSDFNDFFVSSTLAGAFRTRGLGNGQGTDYASLAGWRTAVADDANSLAVDPLFVNAANDLHLAPNSPVRNVGTPIAGVTVDHDNQPRPNPLDSVAVQVDMGGDEFYAPTAASVGVSGQVMTADGSGIRNVVVTIEGGNLPAPLTVLTGSFGRYRFEGLQTGQVYVLTVRGQRYFFKEATRLVQLNDSLTGIDFTGEESER